MKMRDPFRVPLSRQALAVLSELRAITGTGKYLFPEPRQNNRPLETYRLNIALRELGFAADEMQAHGFRSTFSTIANEHSDFSGDAIELALAHQPKGVRAIYNRSKRWTERCELMQWYADYLDGLRKRGEVVALPKANWRKPSAPGRYTQTNLSAPTSLMLTLACFFQVSLKTSRSMPHAPRSAARHGWLTPVHAMKALICARLAGRPST